MNFERRKKNILLLTTILASCPAPTPAPKPPLDAGDAGPDACDVACAAMRTAGCAEGADSHCQAVCQHVVNSGLTPLDVRCLAGALTADDVRRCGVACKTP